MASQSHMTLMLAPELMRPECNSPQHKEKSHKVKGKKKSPDTAFSIPSYSSMALIQMLKPYPISDSDSNGDELENEIIGPLELLYGTLRIDADTIEELSKLNTAIFPKEGEWILSPTGLPDKASLQQLLLYLTSPDAANIEFQKLFLITFSSYVAPEYVMAALYTRYFANMTIPDFPRDKLKPIRMRIIRLITEWSKLSPHHFTDQIKESLGRFLEYFDSDVSSQLLMKVLSTSFEDPDSKNISSKTPPPPPLYPKGHPSDWEIFDVDPIELARQMTIVHSEIFRKIYASELLSAAWGNTNGVGSPHVDQMATSFDLFSRYVSFTVLSDDDPHQRGRIHKRWVDVAEALLSMRNYHGVFSVICGLTHVSITRMTETIKFAMKTNRKRKTAFETMVKLCDFSGDYKNYREVIKTALEPCVPFIGCLQKDLVYVQEGFSNKFGNLLNIKKSEQTYRLIMQVKRFQNEVYPYTPLIEIQNLIKDLVNLPTATDLMRISISKEKKR